MMEIFDGGYLTEEEKATIDTQDLIYLAVSNFTGNPMHEIRPKDVYQYTLKEDGTIVRMHYSNPDQKEGKDILWDCFVNARSTTALLHFQLVFSAYREIEYMDDDGNVHTIKAEEPAAKLLQLDFVGRKKPYTGIMPVYKNTACFLSWVPDDVFLKTLHAFTQKEEKENADLIRRVL
jgi:hypothetical protein